MEIIDLSSRYIQWNNKHSFQIYNALNDQVIWSPPDWWDKIEEAETASMFTKGRVLADMRKIGLVVIKGLRGHDIIFASTERIDRLSVIAVLAVHSKSGQYGYAVMTDDGGLILKPKEYFDTPAKALDAAKVARESITDILEEQCPGKVKFLEIDEKDFIPPDLKNIETKILQKVEEMSKEMLSMAEFPMPEIPEFGQRRARRMVN